MLYTASQLRVILALWFRTVIYVSRGKGERKFIIYLLTNSTTKITAHVHNKISVRNHT